MDRPVGDDFHVVLELQDRQNRPFVEALGGDVVRTIVSSSFKRRMLVMCSLRRYTLEAYNDVLGFENSEFYCKEWKSLTGRTFREISRMMMDAVPVGFVRCEANRPKDATISKGKVHIFDYAHTIEGAFEKFGIGACCPCLFPLFLFQNHIAS